MLTVVERLLYNLSQRTIYLLIVALSVALAASACLIHPAAPIAIIFGFWFVVLTIRSPFTLLVIFVIFLIGRLADFFPILGKLQSGKLLAVAALGVFIISKLQKKDYSIVRTPFSKWFLLFFAALLLSSFFSTWPAESLRIFVSEFSKTMILVFLIINCVTTPRQLVVFQICVAVVCSFIGAYATLANLLGRDPITGTLLVEGSRAAMVGALGDPNDTALVILMTAPFLFLALIESKPKLKIPFALLLVCTIAGIISTQSRGGLLGLAASFGLVMNRYVKNKLIVLAAVIGLLGALAVFANISERKSGGAQEAGIDASAQGRLDAWYAGARMLLKNPLTGVGFQQFPLNFQTYAVNPLEQHARVTHNSYIQVASETGLPGFITFMMLFFLSFKGSLRMAGNVKSTKGDLADVVRVAGLPNCIAIWVPAFFLSVGYSNILFVQFAFIAASIHVFSKDRRGKQE